MSSTDQFADTITYRSDWYREYRHLRGVDEVKKRLERDALFHTLAERGQLTGRMLDVGTATGRYPMLFARAGWRSVGLDVADAAVAMAQEELRRSDITDRVELVCGDIRTVTLPKQSFDLATFMMGTFAHIPDADRIDTLATVHGLLATGGCVVISNWNTSWPDGRMLSLYGSADREWLLRATPAPEETAAMLTAAGFGTVNVQHFCPFTDAQIDHWIGSHEDSPDRIQAYMLNNNISIPGQMYLVAGAKDATGTGE
ncbi:class I SAM-dependent methyltransferase [Micromonospora sp. KC213]|uniref:class I SAM-dependent methyltransferase n=1 Tax=Micromonospora sp. KC213 TaxID=2530378 RepID=UPI001046E9D9|nr:class I SAM-dependent methyltransferase [Micromonospora sp. KC213]TDC39685.1 class I SAM-dependent methyltransferase [Micromonospora sp. KC213]